MRRLLLLGLAAGTLTVAAVACDGGGDGGVGPGPGTPTPAAPPYSFYIYGTSFTGSVGRKASLRVLQGSAATVAFCGTSDTIATGGVFTVSATDVLPAADTYKVELIAHRDSGAVFNLTIDSNYAFSLGLVNTDVNLWHKRPSAQQAVTWTEGAACPGS